MIRYPRTYHHPSSPGAGADDSYIASLDPFSGQEVVVTAKLDGENTTLTRDVIHARSLDSGYHPTRTRVRALHGRLRASIPEGMRICGENLQGTHAITYADLPSPLFVFNVWDERNVALDWDATVEWAALLDLPVVPVLYRGVFDADRVLSLVGSAPPWASEAEGLVCRLAGEIPYADWGTSVFKWVRRGHVSPDEGHWATRSNAPMNGFAPDALA